MGLISMMSLVERIDVVLIVIIQLFLQLVVYLDSILQLVGIQLLDGKSQLIDTTIYSNHSFIRGSIDYTKLADLFSTVVPASSDSNNATTLTLGDIVGIVISILFFIALIFSIYRFFACISRCFYRLRRHKDFSDNDTPTVTTAELSTSSPPIVHAHAIAVGVPSSYDSNPMVT